MLDFHLNFNSFCPSHLIWRTAIFIVSLANFQCFLLVAQSPPTLSETILSRRIDTCFQVLEQSVELSNACFEAIAKSIDENNTLSDSIIALFYHKWGVQNYLTDQYSKAYEHYEIAITLRRKLHRSPHPDIARTLLNQGIALKYHEKYRLAESCLEEALNNYQLLKNESLVTQSHFELGWVKRNIGDLENARFHQQKSLNNYRLLYGEQDYDVAFAYEQLGITLDEIGMHQRAIDHFQRAIEIYRIIDEPYGLANAFHGLGNAFERNGEPQKSIEALLTSLQLNKSFGPENIDAVAADYDDIGLTYKRLQGLDQARLYADSALQIRKKQFTHHPDLAISYDNIGSILADLGLHESALIYFDSARTQILPKKQIENKEPFNPKEILIPSYALEISKDQLNSLVKLQLNGSIDSLESKINQKLNEISLILEFMQSDFALLPSRLHWIQEGKEIYNIAIEYYYRQYTAENRKEALEKALTLIEKNRSLILYEQFVKSQWKNDPHFFLIQKEETQLRAKIEKWKGVTDTPENVNPNDSLIYYSSKLEKIKSDLENGYPDIFLLPDLTTGIQMLRSKLSQQSVLIDFHWTPTSFYQIGIGKNASFFRKIDHQEYNQIKTEALLDWLNHPPHINDHLKYHGQLKELFMLFIGQELISTYEQLIILPDGWLHFFPFEALITGSGTSDYLIRKVALSYHFSIPLYLNSDARSIPFTQKSTATVIAPDYYAHQTLNPLSGTQKEWNTIQQLFSEPKKVESLSSTDHMIYQSDIIHLAMHAVSDSSQLYRSYLAFPQPPDSIQKIYEWMIPNYPWENHLVVLAGCETGTGKYVEGEGLFSLARAFFSSGVPSVVLSQWKSNDASTSNLMQVFYTHLAAKSTPADALQRAKIEYINNPLDETAHPYYWAHLQYWGSIKKATSISKRWYLLIIAIISISCFELIRRNRQKRKAL